MFWERKLTAFQTKIRYLKLSNWDVNDNYISNTYVLKPEAAYKN